MVKFIGDKIRLLRKEKGLSQEELAKKALIHPTYIGQLERAEKNATIVSLEKIAAALDTSLEEFFRGCDSVGKKHGENIHSVINSIQKLNSKDKEDILHIINLLIDWKNRTSA
ncbi:MAG: helix-turn-helix transcriptional regulator [Bacillota bacterium]|nr:helix-turn-helix transcriptional regulator [Bacillota bacterium]